MNKLELGIKYKCEIYMHEHELFDDYELGIVYYKEENKDDSFAYLVNTSNADELLMIKPFTDEEPESIAEWEYSIDEFDFDNLQEGYEIAYMSLDNHHGYWACIADYAPDEIRNTDGLQKYLSYCKKNGITKEILENAVGYELKENVMQYYIEQNQGYSVIAEININNQSIVLAENKNAPATYATWETTPTRKHGYAAGHYFASEKEAKRDYIKRADKEMQRVIQNEFALPTKQEKGEER